MSLRMVVCRSSAFFSSVKSYSSQAVFFLPNICNFLLASFELPFRSSFGKFVMISALESSRFSSSVSTTLEFAPSAP